MNAQEVSQWMVEKIELDGCLYQDDVVDFLVKSKAENLLKENSDGNLAIGLELLKTFKTQTESIVVWVKSDRYWRFRVAEDEPGREARG